jgi:hypothetical protein
MFNFKKDEPPEEIAPEEYVACIAYKIGKDKVVTVDVTVEDYDEYSISQLCLILDLLASDNSYMQTIEILKEGFINAKEEESLEQIYVHLGRQVSHKIVTAMKDTQTQPCIKPSQMLQG